MDREKIIKEWEAVLSRDPLDAPWDLIDDTLTLLKEQEVTEQISDAIHETAKQFRQTIVRCKDCKREEICCIRRKNDPNWFCADGKEREVK